MTGLFFRPVETKDDMVRLDRALRALSGDLGDDHASTAAALAAAIEGPHPAAWALLAQKGDATLGAALFSPVFSTVEGAAGVYVSDLWVSQSARGRGLGRRLLAETVARAARLWRAEWISLAVYADSAASRRFYERLGFVPRTEAGTMVLTRDGTQRLMRETE